MRVHIKRQRDPQLAESDAAPVMLTLTQATGASPQFSMPIDLKIQIFYIY